MVNGIDVSDFQPGVSWSTVKHVGYSFAYSKATEGVSFTAETFDSNWEALAAAGMLRGAYHMFHFDADPIAQANHFLTVVQPRSGDLPPAVDLELDTTTNADQAVTDIAKFLGVVEHVTGTRCVLYLNFFFWQSALASTTGFCGHPLWLAQYNDAPAPAKLPSAWNSWTFWQYTDKRRVDGIAGGVDGDRFNGDLAGLQSLRIP